MAFKRNIEEILAGGPTDWQERLKPSIKLTSPEGTEFEAKWSGDERSLPKKLGIFEIPNAAGDVIQDLGSKSKSYPLAFYFEGPNNDKEATRFLATVEAERGPWAVIHPVLGFITLQPTSLTQVTRPLRSGNVTEISGSWLEPIDPVTLKTAREMAGVIDTQRDEANVSMAQQIADRIQAQTEALRAGIEYSTNTLDKLTDYFLSPLFTTVDAVNTAVNAARQGLTDTLQATELKAYSLAGQVNEIVELPILGDATNEEKLFIYDTMARAYFEELPTSTKTRDLNSALIAELFIGSAIVASCQAVTLGEFQTRAQAYAAAQGLSELFVDATAALDAVQSAFNTQPIDLQYFSNSGAYSSLLKLLGYAIAYLLLIALNLKTEIRFTLDRDTPPIVLCGRLYNDLGLYDLFLDSNKLKGKERLMVPRGREIVYYA